MTTMQILDGGESALVPPEETSPVVHVTDPVQISINGDDPLTVTFRYDLPDNTIILTKIDARDFVLACQTVLQQYPDLLAP